MKTLGLFAVLPIVGILSAGCDGGADGTGGGGAGGGGGTGGTTTTTTTTTTSTTTTTTTTTTEMVAGCPGGQTFAFGETLAGSLEKEGQEDFYRFDGYKGQVLWIDIDAQDLDGVTFDPSYIDSVVAIVDEKGTRLAQNDNPTEFTTADPRLYTILPADGTYCIRVSECWTAKANPGSQCQAPQQKETTYYELTAFELVDDGVGDSNTADPENGDDPASAADVDFVASQSGDYFSAYIWGYYDTETDLDVFTFTLPPDIPVPIGSRSSYGVSTFPTGTNGNGSTSPTGDILIFDPANPDIPVARIDPGQNDEMRVPLEMDKEYWMFVNRPAGAKEENDFYFLSARPAYGNPVESQDATNDDPSTAENIAFSDSDSAFIEGDLIPITDLDHYVVDVPNGQTLVTAVCGARTQGSGLRQMKITLLGDDGMPLSATATDTETSTQLAIVQDIPIGGSTTVTLKVEAGTQAADTSGAYYQCGVHFSTP
ncbi:MAG: pre-peptidase C-terminal domain-containing protein [Polyangiaceae bacterium]